MKMQIVRAYLSLKWLFLEKIFSNAFSWKRHPILLKVVSNCPLDNTLSLVVGIYFGAKQPNLLLAICAGISPVTGEFPSQRPVTWSFNVFLDLRLNKRLSKQSRRRRFKTPPRSLWRHCNGWRMYESPGLNSYCAISGIKYLRCRRHMATENWVNIGSGNGLLPDGTKPLPEPMLSDHQ